jgi:pyridoxamine 5'-phosphate oxidase
MKNSIANIRKDYSLQTLQEEDAHTDAIQQFDKWWQEALHSEIEEVNAMTLATATASGKPTARIVLLKDFDKNGFVFFTNYHSHKGKEMEQNPFACMVFFWKELERQVRIEGSITKLSSPESDAYFNSRPIGSRIGAWASPQSKVIASRNVIEENVAELEKTFAGKDIERPPQWGGYILKPALVEFWQGRSNRLHDRLQYTALNNEGWKIERLAP